MSEHIHLYKLNKIVDAIVPKSEILKISSSINSNAKVFIPLHETYIDIDNLDKNNAPLLILQDIVKRNIVLKMGSNKFEVDKYNTEMAVIKSIASFLDDKKLSQKGQRKNSRVYFSNLLNVSSNNPKINNLLIAIYETMIEKPLSSDTLLKLCKDLNSKYGKTE